MNNQTKTIRNVLFAIAVVVPMSLQMAHANTKPASAKAEKDVETISVVGQKPTFLLKKEMLAAELSFYDAFNALAEEDHHIICKKERQLGSRITERVCKSKLVFDTMSKKMRRAMRQGFSFTSEAQIAALAEKEREASIEYSEALVKQHPSLIKKLVEFNRKKQQYMASKANS